MNDPPFDIRAHRADPLGRPEKKSRPCSYLAIPPALVLLPLLAWAEPRPVTVPVGDGRILNGTVYVPAAPGPAPAVLVLHTRGGLEAADLSYAADLARAGFVSLAVHYLNPQ